MLTFLYVVFPKNFSYSRNIILISIYYQNKYIIPPLLNLTAPYHAKISYLSPEKGLINGPLLKVSV